MKIIIMSDSEKLKILMCGDRYNFDDFRYLFQDEGNLLEFHDASSSLTSAIEKINNSNYFGVFMDSLIFPGGVGSIKYALSSFEEYDDSSTGLHYSTGLFFLNFSREKGLIAVVNSFLCDDKILAIAKDIGATPVDLIKEGFGTLYEAFACRI